MCAFSQGPLGHRKRALGKVEREGRYRQTLREAALLSLLLSRCRYQQLIRLHPEGHRQLLQIVEADVSRFPLDMCHEGPVNLCVVSQFLLAPLL